jgi:uncharacterized protein GlcG (DUF336 family)
MTKAITSITFEEAQVAINAMLAAVKKNPSRPMALAVSDAMGQPLVVCRMDGANDFVRLMVMKKCWTACQLGDNTKATKGSIENEHMTLTDFNHPYATTVPGGVVIVKPGTERDVIPKDKNMKGGVQMARGQIGACAAGGRSSFEDEEIAMVGVRAIQKLVWPEEFKK